MSQRLIAALVAVPLVLGLVVAAALMPLPYVVYRPGLTVDVLGARDDGDAIIGVDGAESYEGEGQLRMTTVTVTPPRPDEVSLLELMAAWVDDENAVVPYETVYRPDETPEENDEEGAQQMVSSQDVAVAVALTELGYDVGPEVLVQVVNEGSPAEGVLRVQDAVLEVDGRAVEQVADVSEAVTAAPEGEPVEFLVRRGEVERTVEVTPTEMDGERRVGISVGADFVLPVDVTIGIPPQISGPSAGLIFSLAIYDRLSPDSLTGGGVVAGTGEIRADGSVGPIGGIDQKIAGAERDGADLFLVPPDNCPDAADADPGDMRLVLARTMSEARVAIETWADDPDADLPSCDDLDDLTALGATR